MGHVVIIQYIDHKIGCSIDYVFGLHLTTFYVFPSAGSV